MTRNLSHQVEVLFPVEDPDHIQYLRDDVLQNCLRQTQRAWVMQSDGKYKHNQIFSDKELDIQEILMTRR